MEQQNNQLQTTTTGLLVVKDEPLLYYPELKDSDITASTVLSDMQKQVILATLNQPKIRSLQIIQGEGDHPNTEAYNQLVDIVGLAIWTMGITEKSMSKDEQKMFIQVAIEEIKTFPNLSIEDVRIAFNRGSRRKYTDSNGNVPLQMSIVTINIWLSKYEEETKHEAMMALKYVKPKELPKPELTREERLKLHNDWLEIIYQKFDEYKETGLYDYYDFGNRLFSYLKKLGIIELSEKQQEKLWNMAVEELKREYHPKNARNYGQTLDFGRFLAALKLDENEDLKPKDYDLIVGRCKKITVKWLFKKLIKEKKHIRDVIESSKAKIINQTGNKKDTKK